MSRRWILATGILLGSLFLGNLPYLAGHSLKPPGWLFWSVPPVNYSDASQYLAFTRMATEGRLLYGDPFTSEPVKPRLVLPHIWLQGAAATLLGGNVLAADEAARVAFGGCLLAAGAGLAFAILRRWRVRWLFLALFGYGAGLGWLFDRAWPGVPHGDRLQPEGNTLFMLGNLPHLLLSAALLALLFLAITLSEAASLRAAIRLALPVSLLLSWTHPFDFVTFAVAMALYLPAKLAVTPAGARGEQFRRTAGVLAAVGGAAAPAALYYAWITGTDPVYRLLASDRLARQPLSFYLVAHGPLLAAAALNLLRPSRRLLLPACWVLGVVLCLASPFRLGGKQPRLVGGVHVPLAILAAAGVDSLSRRAGRLPRPTVFATACAGLLAVTIPGGLAVIGRHLAVYGRLEGDHFLTPPVRELVMRAAKHSPPGAAILAGPYSSTWIPVLTPLRVYHGHWHMTLDEPRKRRERDVFFSPVPGLDRAAWLRRNGVPLVLWYPREWGDAPAQLPGGESLRELDRTDAGRLYAAPDPG